eukprot:Clim_evm22s128 gene=Clim_evmTU22s128
MASREKSPDTGAKRAIPGQEKVERSRLNSNASFVETEEETWPYSFEAIAAAMDQRWQDWDRQFPEVVDIAVVSRSHSNDHAVSSVTRRMETRSDGIAKRRENLLAKKSGDEALQRETSIDFVPGWLVRTLGLQQVVLHFVHHTTIDRRARFMSVDVENETFAGESNSTPVVLKARFEYEAVGTGFVDPTGDVPPPKTIIRRSFQVKARLMKGVDGIIESTVHQGFTRLRIRGATCLKRDAESLTERYGEFLQPWTRTKHSLGNGVDDVPLSEKISGGSGVDSSPLSGKVAPIDDLTDHLYKEGKILKWTNYLSGYQPRYFILDPVTGLLSYYMSEHEVNDRCKGNINVFHGCFLDINPDDDAEFCVFNDSTQYFLKTTTKDERDEWIRRLMALMGLLTGEGRLGRHRTGSETADIDEAMAELSLQQRQILRSTTSPIDEPTAPATGEERMVGKEQIPWDQEALQTVDSLNWQTDELTLLRSLVAKQSAEIQKLLDRLQVEGVEDAKDHSELTRELSMASVMLQGTVASAEERMRDCIDALVDAEEDVAVHIASASR